DSNGVEADVINMEITIIASPTPTLRIHKDHPKNPSWVEAMQEELLQFKIQNVWTLVDCPKGNLLQVSLKMIAVPESSGNSNATATSTNSPTDQLETLTV
nr:hypothetical protein [Tanacetum cinerariifolium]